VGVLLERWTAAGIFQGNNFKKKSVNPSLKKKSVHFITGMRCIREKRMNSVIFNPMRTVVVLANDSSRTRLK
jgi:hypothetical protein